METLNHRFHSVIIVGPLTVCELYSHSTPECLCCIPNPVEDSGKEKSSSEEERNLPASPVFTKKAQPAAVSASGRSLLTLAREARKVNSSSLQGMTNTLETMQQNLDRARQQTTVHSSGPGNQLLLQQLEELQKNFLKMQEQINAQNQAQKSEENKREVQRVLDRMEVKAAERRAVVRENQLKREMEAGLREASEPSTVSTDAGIMRELRRLQQEVSELKDDSTKTHSGSAPPWERREEVPVENKPVPTHFPTRDGPPAVPIPTWRESREEARSRTSHRGLRPQTIAPSDPGPTQYRAISHYQPPSQGNAGVPIHHLGRNAFPQAHSTPLSRMEADWAQQQENDRALQRDIMNTQFRQAGAGGGGDGDGNDDSDDDFFPRGRRANFPRIPKRESSRSPRRGFSGEDQPRTTRKPGDAGREFLKSIKTFNGTNKSAFLEWITRIEAAAKQLKDPVSFSPRTIAFMKSEGSVFTTLSAHAPDAPWEEVKRELASQYSPLPTAMHGILALQDREQEANETLEEFTNEFTRLLKTFKKILPSQCKDPTLIVNYCRGIRSETIREKTCEEIFKFETLMDAIKFARKQENIIIQKQLIMKSAGSKDHPISLFEIKEDTQDIQNTLQDLEEPEAADELK